MTLQVPISPLQQRGLPPVVLVVVFAAVLASVIGLGVVGRSDREQPPAAPSEAALAGPTPTHTPGATAHPTPPPTPIPPCTSGPLPAVADPFPRHPQELVATGFETLSSSPGGFASLVTDRDGSLWEYGSGRLLHLSLSAGISRTWTFADDASFDASGVVAATGGGVWLFGQAWLRWFDGVRFRDVVATPPASEGIIDVAEGPDRSLWAATWPTGLWRWDGEAWGRADECLVVPGWSPQAVQQIAVDADGTVWVAGEGVVALARFDGTTWWRYGEMDSPSLRGRVSSLEPAPDGSVWVGTDQGLTRIDPAGRIVSYGARLGTIGSIAPDPDGTAWVTSTREACGWFPCKFGIAHVEGSPPTFYGPETSPQAPDQSFETFNALRVSADGLFAVVPAGLVHLEGGGRWATIVPAAGPGWVQSVVAVSRQSAWVVGDQGVWRLAGTGWSAPIPNDSLSGASDVAVDAGGAVWVAAGPAAGVYVSGAWHSVNGELGALLSVAVGWDGTAWFGLYGGGVERVRLDGRAFTAALVAPLPGGGDVSTIAVGGDGTVWAGASNSDGSGSHTLARFDGRAWEIVDPVPRTAWVNDIAVAPDGDVWVALAVQKEASDDRIVIGRLHGSRWTTWDETDGVPRWVSSLAVAPDGSVWTAGGGLGHFDGRAWSTVQPDRGFGPISVAPDGTVFVGGPSGLQRLSGWP
jgi:hypothetical protein